MQEKNENIVLGTLNAHYAQKEGVPWSKQTS